MSATAIHVERERPSWLQARELLENLFDLLRIRLKVMRERRRQLYCDLEAAKKAARAVVDGLSQGDMILLSSQLLVEAPELGGVDYDLRMESWRALAANALLYELNLSEHVLRPGVNLRH